MNLTFGSVCSGIGAPEVAWSVLGWSPVWMAEIEPNPSTILAHHYPSAPNMGDMTKLPALVRMRLLVAPDVLVGGTPCQAFSVAGLRAGLDDPRGQLTLKFVDLANAIDEQRNDGDECVVVWENVPGVLSDSGNAFGHFLGALAGEDGPLECAGNKWPNAGLVVGPQRALAWRVLDAQYFGVAQRRRRVFVVASARNGFDPATVLFELGSMRRDSAPRRETGENVAGTLGSRASSGGGFSTDFECAGGVQPVAADFRNMVATGDLAHALQCGGHGVSPSNTPHVLTFHAEAQPDEMRFDSHVSASLTCSQHAAVSYAIQAGALRTNPDSGPDGVGVQSHIAYTLEARAEVQAVCVTGRGQPIVAALALRGRDGGATAEMGDNCGFTLRASTGGDDKPHALVGMAVRRLTPRECERLQGFPDDYTLVPLADRRAGGRPGDRRGEPRMMADGPRYKALGNSMCVFVMRWLGQQIAANR